MRRFCILLVTLLASHFVYSQPIDDLSNHKIKEYTTDTKFLPASVLNLVDDPKVPSPRKHFGDIIGAPGVMHRTADLYKYYQTLAQASPYLRVQQVGTTEEGRPINLVIIGNEDAISRMDFYRNQLALLADPRKVTGDVNTIINSVKPVFYLNGGLHSPEMGSPEMLMELAYRLITDNTEPIRAIRDNVIVLINPASEPDGRDKQVDWYYRYTKAKKDFDDGFPRSSPYWGRHIYHDNNRDGIQVSAALTKAVFKIYFDWHPTVMLDLHESVPLIYMSTGTGPYNETIDPIAIGEWQVFANHDITALATQGLPGAFTWAFYDGWWPGYGIWVANNHNSVGRFYETFGNAGANTYLRDLADNRYAGDLVTSREWYRPDPATEKVVWSARNNINYMEAAVLASLDYTARNKIQLLKNFYQKGVNSINKGKNDKPRAYVIPSKQRDPNMAAYLVNQLRVQGIEVHRAESGDKKGDYVVLLDQPYRNLAVSLLSKQNYPKEAKFPPYDDIAWTLGYLYGVDVKAEDSIKYNTSDLTMINADVRHDGVISGDGGTYVLNYKAQNTALSAMYWLKSKNAKAGISVMDSSSVVGKDTLAAGAVIFTGITSDQAKTLTTQYGLDLIATSSVPKGKNHNITVPRVAIYHTWYNTQDEGWSRYTFEQRGIPYTSIDKDDLKAGNLNLKYDVILVPRAAGTASRFIHGIETKYGPMPYTKTAEFPAHGTPDSTPDMTGGPGFDGMNNLKKFVDNGGVLITLDNSTVMAAETGIIRALDRYNAAGLFHPGSVVSVKGRNMKNPVLYGYPQNFHIFRGNGPLFEVDKRDRGMMLLQYGSKPLKDEEEYKGEILGMPKKPAVKKEEKKAPEKNDPYVLSGMVRNENTIIGHGAIFNVPQGNGRVIAFTFDPLHRYLNHHDAPMVWNALINWNYLK